MPQYKIAITKITNEMKPRRVWQKVRDEGEKYEYVDDEWWQEKSEDIYEQIVESLDLSAVIKAVNDLA